MNIGRRGVCGVVATVAMAIAGTSRAQVAGGGGGGGFFGGNGVGAVAFDPEPAAIFTGVGLWVGATVTSDLKYVHLNMVPQQTAVTSVQKFQVFFAGGFVGAADAGGQASFERPLDPGLKGSSGEPPMMVSSSAPWTGVLAARGMTRMASLD